MRDVLAKLAEATHVGPSGLGSNEAVGLSNGSSQVAVEDLARLAALACGMPMAVASIRAGESKRDIKGYGLTDDQALRAVGLSERGWAQAETLCVVPDTLVDARMAQEPLVTGAPRVRSMVLLPFTSPGRALVGRVCLFDHVARVLTTDQTDALTRLGRLATHHLCVREARTGLEVRLALVESAHRDVTERAQYYLRVFQTTQGFIWWHRPDGTIAQVSDGACEALGCVREDLIGRNLRDLVPVEHQPAFERSLGLANDTGTFRGLLTLQAIDGRRIALAYQTSSFELPEGRRIMGHGVDISDRIRIEAFNRRLAKVLEATPDFVGFFDQTGQPTYLNRAAREMCGIGHSEDVAKVSLRDLQGGETGAHAFQTAMMHAAEHGPHTSQRIIRGRRGRETPVSQLLVAHRAQNGSVEFYAALARDISDRIRDEQVVLDGERRFRRVVESLQEVLFEADSSGLWSYLNPAWTDMTGFSVGESLARSMAEFLSADDEDGNQPEVEVLLRRETQISIQQARCRTRDGGFRWVEINARPVLDGDGHVVGTSGTLRDITEQRELSEALMKSGREALAASRLKSEFVANMSHEVRTPINGVIGLTSLLLESSLTAEQRDYAEGVKQSADALLAIVNDVLDLSKIEAGTLTIEPITFDLRRTIALALEPVAVKARHKGLTLTVECADDVPESIVSDPTRLRQLLINLSDNAVKFTHSGGVLVGVQRIARDGVERLRFAVTDCGIGIAADKLGTIFEKFTQADSSTTRKYGGTGLGLAICRQLAELMGGQIGLESEPGRGSTLWFVLPLLRAASPTVVEQVKTASIIRPGVRVLVAEDNAINQKVARKFLEEHGCVVEFADNGVEALARVGERAYDVVFMDCQMPQMDGYEATRQIRQLAHRTGLPIVAMTAHAMQGDREKCLEAGMSDYLSKPLQREALAAVLARWTTPQSASQEETAA